MNPRDGCDTSRACVRVRAHAIARRAGSPSGFGIRSRSATACVHAGLRAPHVRRAHSEGGSR
jgi:hypothetical protein